MRYTPNKPISLNNHPPFPFPAKAKRWWDTGTDIIIFGKDGSFNAYCPTMGGHNVNGPASDGWKDEYAGHCMHVWHDDFYVPPNLGKFKTGKQTILTMREVILP
jgi:hypothetical protein